MEATNVPLDRVHVASMCFPQLRHLHVSSPTPLEAAAAMEVEGHGGAAPAAVGGPSGMEADDVDVDDEAVDEETRRQRERAAEEERVTQLLRRTVLDASVLPRRLITLDASQCGQLIRVVSRWRQGVGR